MTARNKAKLSGEKTYQSVGFCKNGHLNPLRRTDNGSCCECIKEKKSAAADRQKRFKDARPERLREIKRESMRKSRAENPERHKKYNRDRMRKINKTTEGKLKQFIKGAIRRCVEHKKGKKSYDVVGYGYSELRESIQSKFKDGMSWDNYGEWHIDHIKPISVFISEGVKDSSIINALDNLQPLWAFDNISKGAKY